MDDMWFIAGLIIAASWSLFVAFFVSPVMVLRRFMKEMEDTRFRGIVANYMIGMLNTEQTFKDEKGAEVKLTLFQALLAQATDYGFQRLDLWIMAQKSALSRSLDKAAIEANPLYGLVGKALPKKYKDFAPLAMQFLQSGALNGAPPSNAQASAGQHTQNANKFI